MQLLGATAVAHSVTLAIAVDNSHSCHRQLVQLPSVSLSGISHCMWKVVGARVAEAV